MRNESQSAASLDEALLLECQDLKFGRSNASTIVSLLRKKANADCVDSNGQRPLHFTCRLHRAEIEEKAVQVSAT